MNSNQVDQPAKAVSHSLSRIRLIVVGVIVLVPCVWTAYDMGEVLSASSWPQTDGVVESVQVYEERDHEGQRHGQVDILYRYTVDGVVYHGTRFNWNHNGIEVNEVPAISTAICAGAGYRIAYNPRDPSRSYLHTRVDAVFMVALVTLALVGLMALTAIVRAVRQIVCADSTLPGAFTAAAPTAA